MAMNKYDSIFLKHFAQLIGALFVVMILLMFVGHGIYSKQPKNESPRRAAEQAARIAPEGAAYAGATGQAAKAAAEEAARKAAQALVAYDGSTDGSVIFGKLCTACHGT